LHQIKHSASQLINKLGVDIKLIGCLRFQLWLYWWQAVALRSPGSLRIIICLNSSEIKHHPFRDNEPLLRRLGSA
jgi:hypothetical protein